MSPNILSACLCTNPFIQQHCLSPIDVKLNFCCNESKFKLNWYICANTIDVVKNFAVIKNVAVKSFHCISSKLIKVYKIFFIANIMALELENLSLGFANNKGADL